MLGTLFWVLVGVLIGWHVQQPEWVKTLKAKVLSVFKK